VFAEEWGYVGALVLLLLYAALVLRGLQVASRSKDRFGALLAFGIVTIVFWQVIINVGMTSGVLPVVGIPLPFFSYGGSSLTTMMVAMGLVNNVNMRRFSF
jgi:rod shape determining protein RodA